MADEMDPCECLWNHELAMRRLITLLRNGQSYCTDTGCVDLPSTHGAGANAGQGFLMLFMTLAFAVAWFALRPRARAVAYDQVPAKPAPNQDHDDGAPPTPPRI